MWAVLLTAGTALALMRRWQASRLPWPEFVVLGTGWILARLWHRLDWKNPVTLPATGPVLILANHTSSADGWFLLCSCPRLVGFLASREHYAVHPLVRRFLDYIGCIPVTRDGRDPVAARRALRRLDEGKVLGLFPEGNLSGVKRGRLHQPKAGIAWLALHRNVPVLPVWIAGGPRTDRLLKAWFNPRHSPVRLFWGKPVDLSAFRGRPLTRPLLEEITGFLMNQLQALKPHP